MLNVKLILRNLVKVRSYTALNIIGLAIGLSSAFAVIGWLNNELSYDKHLPEANRTYRLTFETITSGNRLHFARCWEKWVWQMPGVFPQIEEMIRLSPYRHTAIKIEENKLYSDRVFATDSNFFKVFGIDLLSGDVENVLNEPYSAVISSSLASKCFGDKDPVGQAILLSGEYDTKMILFNIKGVMKDSPIKSHIHFDILTSFTNPKEAPAWAYVYLLLKQNVNPDDILSGLPSFIEDVEKEHDQTTFTPHLQKISDIHLFSNKDREIEPNGNISTIYLFIIIVIVLLLVSWVNYYNLNKARIFTLRKQIHIQRITGSSNWLIIIQSVIESGICVVLATIVAIFLLNLLSNPAISLFDISLLANGLSGLINIWPMVLCILVISIFAGSLPVIIFTLSEKSLPGIKESPHKSGPRLSSFGILMTLQFSLSIVLVVAAITIYRQKELILSSSMGKMSSDILVFKNQNWEIRNKYNAFRDKALQDPLIKSFTASMEEPSGETADAIQVESSAIDEAHKDNQLYFLVVEDNFLDFFDIPLIAGRNFSPYNPDRKGEDYILNETAIKQLGWTPEQAIGNPFNIKFSTPDIFYGGTVIGVVRDFYFTTIRQEIKPYFLVQKPIFYLTYLVEVDSVHKDIAIQNLKNIWEEELPDYPFQYEFMSDMYNSAYQSELTQSKLTTIFSVLAIIIICVGLFSVSSVLFERRTKEIGVRKVNGAKISDILVKLIYNYIKWFTIGLVIACPVAWFIMHKWLENFVYKTELSWWMFAVAGAIVLVVTLLTVNIKSWKAATRNPVKALRYE